MEKGNPMDNIAQLPTSMLESIERGGTLVETLRIDANHAIDIAVAVLAITADEARQRGDLRVMAGCATCITELVQARDA